jgi:hypothetical protein
MTRLPPVLTTADLPLAELCAARLDGEVFAIDSCFSPIDQFESPRLRAAAISSQWPYRLIAEQHSAAWVLGASDSLPTRHDLCADIRARARPTSVRLANVREVVIEPHEIVRIGALDVTGPLRTVVDLARFSRDFGEAERLMCSRLMRMGVFGFEECTEVLLRRRNLPNKNLALRRIASIPGPEEAGEGASVATRSAGAHAVDVVDRVNATHCA